MNDTLNVKYARFPQISVRLNIKPIGTMARLYRIHHQQLILQSFPEAIAVSRLGAYMYVSVVIGTLWRESSVLVKRAMYWVMMVPKT